MMFDYLAEKINDAEIKKEPFSHIYIENFFSNDDFQKIIKSTEINLNNLNSTRDLYKRLIKLGYKAIDFPGCTKNIEEYLNWEKGGYFHNVDTTEGFGMVFRLEDQKSIFLSELKKFLDSKTIKNLFCRKFDLSTDNVYLDSGIQKYLNGYEISPHPDLRSKALTYMININPNLNSESNYFHTHYRFINIK